MRARDGLAGKPAIARFLADFVAARIHFYEDTSRIDAFDRRLTELGIARVS